MLSLFIMLAGADPDLVSLRYDTSLAAWSICVDKQIEKTKSGPPEMTKATRVQFAMTRCYVFSQDFKRTLPDAVAAYLKKDGIESYSPQVVDTLAEDTFRRVEAELRMEKEAE